MPNIDRIEGFADELTAIRRDLHANPEIGFEEVRTSGIAADRLTQWGIEVHRGLGGTGVVGVLKGHGNGGKRIGLRADMDALPMEENTNLRWRSTIPGRFHGCGHDGHTTMLLGTARYLAETRNFDGTVHLIFQPAEEGLGTARAFSDEVRALIRERMRAICAGIASAFQVDISVDIRDTFSVLVNQEEQSRVIEAVARTVVDPAKVFTRSQPKMGSEDFADMLHAVPGAYFWLGHEGSVPVHNPGYVLDDKILPIGASMFARIVETRLPVGGHA